ncbi:rifin PIR protein, putative [Plasmodium reichenowi]|uniref:Rifin PIR protein, putative n=1 Tax=Plasmodium reichenowi TaxID=5854 RepID=A0A2P9D3X9_PLARE|nr:rifin PIR protein, putative [Plasmodium reichenowi]
MKVHYINILLSALPLNILVYTPQKKPHNTPHHTPKILTTRLLCECELYAPSNYDSDPQMKEVMENFNKQTQQRFHEYDERMKTTRQKCKEQCDKDIQKIMAKDKMEKLLAQKIEKGCLRCGCGLGGVAASVGIFGAVAVNEVTKAATAAAIAKVAADAKAAGDAVGVNTLISGLKDGFVIQNLFDRQLAEFITTKNYCDATLISKGVELKYKSCLAGSSACENYPLFSYYKSMPEGQGIKSVVDNAKTVVEEAVKKANDMTVQVTKSEMETLKTGKLAEIATESSHLYMQLVTPSLPY